MQLSVKIEGSGFAIFDNMTRALADGEIAVIARRALNHTGAKAKTAVTRALTQQTGLKRKVIVRALKVGKASAGRLSYSIEASGGDISLKYFGARETLRGVSAAPFGQRQIFAGTFIKGGRFPGRVDIGKGGHVFSRIGKGRKFERRDSGVYIPKELVTGATADAFKTAAEELTRRIAHEMSFSRDLQSLTGGSRY